MSRFYASIKGNKGEATRQGSEASGLDAHIRGWDCGIRITAVVNPDGKDCFRVFKTGGSNDSTNTELIAKVTEE